MNKNLLSEEILRMKRLSGIISESEYQEQMEDVTEGRWGRGGDDPWADIETGGEHSMSKERRKNAYKREKEEDQNFNSSTSQSFLSRIKRLGDLMTKSEASEMMDQMKHKLSHDEIIGLYRYMNLNNISSPIFTELSTYAGETGNFY